ncbi:AGAP001048-PA-like protein [Anopheles sinensis]|uniref:AGAP001048-PA-like protein n=1 Tax=Anopheles sinensis TaxID=74873 RepID=A0A084VV20_ANOSI|nr:AGAP001048-PA-like protein [Anopheles sinensis]
MPRLCSALCGKSDPFREGRLGYLDVVIPPDFIAEDTSSDVIVPEGSSVKLTCRAKGYPGPVVTWRREDGTEIVLKDATGTKQLVTSYRGEVLKLTKISRSEMGSYLCIASNGVPPSVSKRISLSIHFHPVIQVPNQLVGAPLGTDVTIECQVEASPKSINYWVKDTGEMIVSSPKYHVQDVTKSLYETKMSMTVRSFQKEDVGSYRCIAKNSLGEVDSSIRLYEIPGPSRKVYAPKFDQNEIAKDGGKQQQQQLGKTKVSAYPPDDDDQQYGSAEDLDDMLDTSLGTHQHHQHHNAHSHQHQHHQLPAGGFKLAVGGTARSPYDHPNSINGLGPNGNKHLPAIDLATRKPHAMPPVRNGPDGVDGAGGLSYGQSMAAHLPTSSYLLTTLLSALSFLLLANGCQLLH